METDYNGRNYSMKIRNSTEERMWKVLPRARRMKNRSCRSYVPAEVYRMVSIILLQNVLLGETSAE